MAKKKEVDFFELMQEEAKFTSELTVKLKVLFSEFKENSGIEKLQERLNEIHSIEHKGDIVAHLQLVQGHLFDVDEVSLVIHACHRSCQYRVRGKSEYSQSHQCYRDDHKEYHDRS